MKQKTRIRWTHSEKSAPPNKRQILVQALFTGALVIASTMAWRSISGHELPGCGSDSGCAGVVKSRWGSLLGMPVSVFGVIVYTVLLGSTLVRIQPARVAVQVRMMAGVLVLAGAVWFTIVQAVILKAFCPWCCTAHALASLGVLLSPMTPSACPATPDLSRSSKVWGVAAALSAIASMAIIQGVSPMPERIERVSIGAGSLTGPNAGQATANHTIDPTELPWIGTPGAGVTATVLTDFTCPHCRELLQTLAEASNQLGGRLGVALVPGYHNAKGRELHRIMLALWKLDHVEYQRISNALIEATIQPDTEAVIGAAERGLDKPFYRAAWEHGEWIEETLRMGKQLMARNEARLGLETLPQLGIGDEVIAGAPRMDTVLEMVEQAATGAPNPLASPVVVSAAHPSGRAVSGPSVADPIAATLAPMAASNPPNPSDAEPQAPAPKIAFAQTTIDLGKVNKGETPTAKFEFRNVGDVPLQLTKLKPQCGCTTIEGWQQSVEPGEKASFEVKLNTARFNGVITKSIDYATSAGNDHGKLFIRANVWAPVHVSASMVSFGSVIKGSTVPPRPVRITVQDGETIRPEGITCSNPFFKWTLQTIREGRDYQLEVSVPELGDKPKRGEIVIPLGHSKLMEARLPLYANPVDPLVVQPREILKGHEILTRASGAAITVYCHDTRLADFEVSGISYTGEQNVQTTLEMKPGYRWGKILATFPEGFDMKAAQERNARIKFHTNHPDHPEVSVPVRMAPSPSTASQSADASRRAG